MVKITVFETREDDTAYNWEELYNQDFNKLEELFNRVEAKEREYKDITGWTDNFMRKQDEMDKRGEILTKFSPYKVAMSEEENNKFRAQYPNIGEGLELRCYILLSAFEEQPCGETWYQLIARGPDGPDTDGDKCTTIQELVQDTYRITTELSRTFYGAKINPQFYTTLERISTEGIIRDLSDALKIVSEEEFKGVFGINKPGKEVLEKMIESRFTVMKGLSKQEREEFERLFLRINH